MNFRFLEIDNVTVTQEVIEKNFTCDLEKCKGACCTMESEYGAPLLESEIETIANILPAVKEYLDSEKIEYIEKNGFFEKKFDQLMTTSINNLDCVFVYHTDGIAKCAIEKAFSDGKIDFRKPVSCHLFPIRITEFGGPVVRYESYSECESALELGNETRTKVYEFCKDSLERLFGEEWYRKLLNRLNKE